MFSTNSTEAVTNSDQPGEKMLQALLDDPYQNDQLAMLCDVAADYVYGHWNDKF